MLCISVGISNTILYYQKKKKNVWFKRTYYRLHLYSGVAKIFQGGGG